MKSKLVFIAILLFSFMLQATDICHRGNDNRDSMDIIPNLSDTISAEDSWYFIWDSGYGGLGIDIALDSSNNIYIAGEQHQTNHWVSLFKFDSSSYYLWDHNWSNYYGSSPTGGIVVDSSDNVYFAGKGLVKYNKLGVEQWNKTWGGSDYESGHEIALDSSDNIYLVGITESFGAGDFDIALVKYNSDGVMQYNMTWGESDYDSGEAIVLDSSDNIFLLGTTERLGSFHMFLMKNPHLNPTEISPFKPSKTKQDIPGFNLFILYGIILVALVMIIRMRKKS